MRVFPKQFINLHEVALILNQQGYSFDPNDIKNPLLQDTIADFTREYNLVNYYHYRGRAICSIYDKSSAKALLFRKECYVDGYFYQNRLPNEVDNMFNIEGDYIPVLPFHVNRDIKQDLDKYDLNHLDFNNCIITYSVPKPTRDVMYEDLRFLQSDLVDILNSNDLNSSHQSQQKQSALEAEETLHPRTANNAAKIISALASELLKMDITQPYSKDVNGKIKAAIERQGNSISKDVIADWLKLAHEQSK